MMLLINSESRRAAAAALVSACASVLLVACSTATSAPSADDLQAKKVMLGKQIFFDSNLSEPAGQSCASCHDPETGFAEPNRELPVSQGANLNLVGNRNAPSAAYAAFSPPFHFDGDEGLFVGGQFLDGRAADLVEQAKAPFLNPLEMANTDAAMVIGKLRLAPYAELFLEVYGASALNDVDSAYHDLADAIAAFEASSELNRFSSKYDAYLRGEATLTPQERRGLELFEDPLAGNCAACHPSQPAGDAEPPLFTDFTYDNIGLPRNEANPFYSLPPEYNPEGQSFVDLGLGGALADPAEDGKFKVPTLRNVAVTGPWGHNGVFTELREVVRFYATRDTDASWAAPEVEVNVNVAELGDLPLSNGDVDDITAFLMTLTDRYSPAP